MITSWGCFWIGFWVFATTMMCLDFHLYKQGHDTFFYVHKTKQELKIQDEIINSH